MTYKIKLTPTAKIELSDGVAYYAKINRKIAQIFIKALKLILDDIQQEPLHYREIGKGFRQVPVKKFPFVIIYEIKAETVVVHAFFHTSRNPNQKPL